MRGGTVWAETGPRRADVLVQGETIAAIGDQLGDMQDAELLDATGLDVLPGLIDAHVHLDDQMGGVTLADDFASGSEIAVCNGVTTVAAFAVQQEGESLSQAAHRMGQKGEGKSHCDFLFHLTPTGWPWNWQEVEKLLEAGHPTVELHTTSLNGGPSVSNEQLAEAMRRLAPLGGRLLIHCEDDDALAHISPAWVNLKDAANHGCLRPANAELAAVARVVDLAQETGCHVHVVHVSSPGAAEAVAVARERLPISLDTAPAYLLLDDSLLEGRGGHRFICTPPLRSSALRERLEAQLVAGAFDLLASDHCPVQRHDKDSWRDDFRTVPGGLPGVGALLPLTHELLVSRCGFGLQVVVRLLAANPARLLGLHPRKGALTVGADADLVVLDTSGPARPVLPTLAFCHNPYAAFSTNLDVRWVLLRGQVVVKDNGLAEAQMPRGELVKAVP